MNVLVIGQGGREHALVWKIAQSQLVDQIYCWPGNPGMDEFSINLSIPFVNEMDSYRQVVEFVKSEGIDLTIVGPEDPLAAGIVDSFHKHNLYVFGPDAFCAQLESSKVFARDIMAEYNIPHPKYFACKSREETIKAREVLGLPIVLKADGLAAGKGVLVSSDIEEADNFISSIFAGKIGTVKSKVIIEEYLEGKEMSVFFAIDKKTIKYIGSAQDYKRAFDHDRGPNTGGMGAFSPSPLLTKKILEKILNKIIKPTVEYMKETGNEFSGILYAGLVLNNGEPKLIEYNVRFGDPECQALCVRLGAQIFDIYFSGAKNELSSLSINEACDSAITVIVAEKGYPKNPRSDCELNDIVDIKFNKALKIFHAGTYFKNNFLCNTGGRIFSFTVRSKNLKDARTIVYKELTKIENDNVFYRTDIGTY